MVRACIDKSLAILTAQHISTMSLDLAASKASTKDVTGPAAPSTAVALVQQCFTSHNRGVKRKHQEDENKDQANQVEDSLQADADDDMQRVENSYHVALVKLLRQPAFYKQLGFCGPPHTIAHSSLQDRLDSMRVVW